MNVIDVYLQAFGDRYPRQGTSSFFISCGLCGASVEQDFRHHHTEWHHRRDDYIHTPTSKDQL